MTWEQRGMVRYYLDATGKILGEVSYSLVTQVYRATLGDILLGRFVDIAQAMHAVEQAVQHQAQEPT